jgi:hypothetical protein
MEVIIMKRKNSKKLICLLAAALLMAGCTSQGGAAPEPPAEAKPGETQAQASPGETHVPTEDVLAGIKVYAPGPYGELSVILPGDWVYQPYASGSENSNSGSYGMWIRPADQETGYIDLCYMKNFGVCGTGLKQETMTLAGDSASVGTYDNHSTWDFIVFQGINEGIWAQSVMADTWPSYQLEKALSVLDTLALDRDQTQGAVSYFKSDSEIPGIGLIAEGHDVTSSGMTIRFSVWDPELTKGDLEFSEGFWLEKLEGNEWTALPVTVEGDWAFTEEAHIISKDPESPGTDWQVNWEWLYGKLGPGDYRIGKTVLDFRAPGDYTEYPVYVYFRNGGEIQGPQNKGGEWLSPQT